MKRVRLNSFEIGRKARYTLIDEKDFHYFEKWTWYVSKQGYVVRGGSIKGKKTTLRFHRILLNPARNMVVDHKNQNKLDNRRENLRICSISQNRANCSYVRAKSGVKCVHKYYRKWRANIRKDGKNYWLGLFHKRKEAKAAYDKAAKELFGEFAVN